MTYEIRKGVPVPPRGLTDTIRKMECGDSIVIPVNRRVAAHNSARSIGAKVKTKANHDGTLTVWRIDSGPAGDTSKSIFGDPTPITSASAVAEPAPPHNGPVPEWPKIARTKASPELGLPEGYYIQRGPYDPELWLQGTPPEGPYSQLKETLLDKYQTADDADAAKKEIFS